MAHPAQATLEAETSLLPRSIGLVIALNRGWRVSEDELQWLLQRYQGGRWRDRSFCRTREALAALHPRVLRFCRPHWSDAG